MRDRLRPLGTLCWTFGILVLAVVLYAGLRHARGWTPFVVREVRVVGNTHTPADRVVTAAHLAVGTDLLGLDVGTARHAVERLPWIRQARVVRTLPSTVTVSVVEWEPRALVRLDRLYYLTGGGELIRSPLDQGLHYPVVTGVSRAQLIGGDQRDLLLSTLAVLGRRAPPEPVSEIHLDPDTGVTLYLVARSGSGVRLGFGDFEAKLDRLDRLRRYLARRDRAAIAVNLDFDDKILARLGPARRKEHRR